jgi:hypothetical protein
MGQISSASRIARRTAQNRAAESRAGRGQQEARRRPSWRGHGIEIDVFERNRLSVLHELSVGQSHA